MENNRKVLILGLILMIRLFGISQTINGQKNYNDIDSLNNYINNIINSKPPTIQFYFYIGNDILKKHKVHIYLNDMLLKTVKRKKLVLDTLQFKKYDSLSFSFVYNNLKITTNKVNYRRFLHGGKVIFGVLNNYAEEKSEYLRDGGVTYLQKYRNNYLYEIMRNSILNNLTIKRSFLLYSIILSNSSGKTQIKIEPEIN